MTTVNSVDLNELYISFYSNYKLFRQCIRTDMIQRLFHFIIPLCHHIQRTSCLDILNLLRRKRMRQLSVPRLSVSRLYL